MRRRHVVGVAGFAIAAQLHVAVAAAVGGMTALEHRKAAGFAEREPIAGRVERPARLRRHQSQRIEAVQHAAAQGVDAADQGGIGEPGFDQPCRLCEHLGTGRTRRRHGHARAAQAGRLAHEIAQRMQGMHDRSLHGLGKLRRPVGAGLQLRVGLLGFADAGGRGAEHQRHALGAVAFAHDRKRIKHVVLLQRQPGEAIVAAFPARELGRQWRILEAVDAPDPGVEGGIAEIIAAQASTARPQGIGLRGTAAAERSRCGVSMDGQRRHGLGALDMQQLRWRHARLRSNLNSLNAARARNQAREDRSRV